MITTLVLSPLGRQTTSTEEVINLAVYLSDEDFVGVYDRIEIWRSKGTQSGPYEEITSPKMATARIPKGAEDAPSVAVDGPSAVLVDKDVSFLVNNTSAISVVFTGTDPLTFAQAAEQITAASVLLNSYVTAEGMLVAETIAVGTEAVLSVTGGEAASILGLPTEDPDATAYGKDARPVLSEGVGQYTFTDLRGSSDYYYKIRLSHSQTGAVGEFSLPYSVGAQVGLSPTSLIRGTIDLVQQNGKPAVGYAVTTHSEFNGVIVDGKAMIGGQDGYTITDEAGHSEFMLVRGQKVSISIPGSSMYRTITVPTDPALTTFNMLDPNIADEDIFKVQVPNIVVASRRSL